MTFESEVEVSTFTNAQLFARARDLLMEERTSDMHWAALPDDRRSILCTYVSRMLTRMAENPDVWLPKSLEPGKSDWIKVGIRFQMSQIDDGTVQADIANQQKRREAIEELLAIASAA